MYKSPNICCYPAVESELKIKYVYLCTLKAKLPDN